MLEVLLVGRKLSIVDETRTKAEALGTRLYAATGLEEAAQILKEHDLAAVILGAGVDLEQRLAIVRATFETSDRVEIHMKDTASGPEGFLPFVEDLLAMLTKNRINAS